MKNIITGLLLFFSVCVFAQQQVNIEIDPGQSKNKQYIGISSNGKKPLSNIRQPYGTHEIKGHFKSILLTDLADAITEYVTNNIDLDQLNIDSTFATVEYTDSIFATLQYVDSTFAPDLYDEYSAELTLSGTNNPSAGVSDSLVGRTVTWTREGAGLYVADIDPVLSTSQVIFIQSSIGVDPEINFITGLDFGGGIYIQAYLGSIETDVNGAIYITAKIFNQ